MSDVTAKISVIAARLPYTDRRALSEAWFSALHLASDGALSPKPRERRGEGAASRPHGYARDPLHAGAPGVPLQRLHGAGSVRSDARVARESEPRRATPLRSGAARDVFALARSYAAFRTSLTFGVAGERVALLLRREGATLHVVALCRPAVADIVRRALARADLALRTQGESIRASVTTFTSGDRA
jgi:hypothetical protein